MTIKGRTLCFLSGSSQSEGLKRLKYPIGSVRLYKFLNRAEVGGKNKSSNNACLFKVRVTQTKLHQSQNISDGKKNDTN